MSDDYNEFDSLLVIDDNEEIHKDFRKIFTQTDFTMELDELDVELFGEPDAVAVSQTEFKLHFASQGQAGLKVLQEAMQKGIFFGAAFIDMRMPPGWDGVETITNLWKFDPDLQVVICTAFSDQSWEDIISKLGRTDQLLILKKPFDEIEVIQLASSLCEKRRLLEKSKSRVEHLQEVVEVQGSKLQDAHKDAEVLIASMPSVLISVSEDGVVSRWNPVAVKLFGIEPIHAIGKNFVDLPIQWSDWSTIENSLQNCADIQQKQIEIQFTDNSGRLKTLDATICPILNDATTKARLILATDVTVQNAMQCQLDQALRLESVGQLAAGVAHEINTPMQYIGDNVRFVAKSLGKLTPILDCLPALVDPDVTDEQLIEIRKAILGTAKTSKVKSSLQQIPDALADSIEGVEAVSKIVAAMKEFSHPGSDQKSMVCVNHILESTVTVAKNEWKYVADVEKDLEEDLIEVDAFPSELNQAFLNIIVNAAHAIGDRVKAKEMSKGLIKISTRSNVDSVSISIQDNGGGIPLSAREKVFEPFFTTKDVGKGTGQGLAIAFAVIARKHGGQLSFDVEEGVGTTFKIELPRESLAQTQPENEVLEVI